MSFGIYLLSSDLTKDFPLQNLNESQREMLQNFITVLPAGARSKVMSLALKPDMDVNLIVSNGHYSLKFIFLADGSASYFQMLHFKTFSDWEVLGLLPYPIQDLSSRLLAQADIRLDESTKEQRQTLHQLLIALSFAGRVGDPTYSLQEGGELSIDWNVGMSHAGCYIEPTGGISFYVYDYASSVIWHSRGSSRFLFAPFNDEDAQRFLSLSNRIRISSEPELVDTDVNSSEEDFQHWAKNPPYFTKDGYNIACYYLELAYFLKKHIL